MDMNEQGDGRAPSAAEPSMSTSKPALDHELPDPDEDDLDDLDGILHIRSLATIRRLRYIRAPR